MEAVTVNLLRSVAKECRAEILKRAKQAPISERDKITTEILDKHTKKISGLKFDRFSPKRWLTYYIYEVSKEKAGKH